MIVFLSLIILLGDIPGGSTDECLPNSSGIDQQCSPVIGNKCTKEDDCPIPNTICDQVCKCKGGMHPSEDKNFCETDVKRIGDSCKDDECNTIENAVCKQTNVKTKFFGNKIWDTESTCQCKLNHFLSNLKCVKYANDLRDRCEDNRECYKIIGSKKCNKTTNTCQCNEKIYYLADGKCHKKTKNLHESCSNPSGCKPKFSECLNNECQCGSKYNEYNNVCYGLLNATCSQPSDCLSTSYSCGSSGTCENVEHKNGDKVLSSKPKITLSWINFNNKTKIGDGVYAGADGPGDIHVCRGVYENLLIPGKLLKLFNAHNYQCHVSYLNTEPDLMEFEMLSGSSLRWKESSFTLDKAVYGGANEDNKPYLICRTKHTIYQDRIIVGKLEPPLYKTCVAPFGRTVYYYKKFDILVHD
ncbi:GSCOCT00014338001.2-RA-CDS [Cotesia congregata]|uniref:Venom protein 21 n=1 Tax=Cotesia congregata TaxID=51543 RepID=A0A8J2EBB1_COTCN|nr:GSCOCT00014338001.2-RA-CDS [Cotesia congregata]CAG5074223.1 Putative venom protein 21 [Cotesia congregata]